LNGSYKEYYATGQAKVEGNYVKGMFDGKWIYFQQDGTIIGMGEYENGTGKQRAWYPDGKLKRIVRYENNLKQGQEIWYDLEGKIEKKLEYARGELVNTGNQSD